VFQSQLLYKDRCRFLFDYRLFGYNEPQRPDPTVEFMAQFLNVHPTHPQPRLVRRAAEILAALKL